MKKSVVLDNDMVWTHLKHDTMKELVDTMKELASTQNILILLSFIQYGVTIKTLA